jgi:hypothetical protein
MSQGVSKLLNIALSTSPKSFFGGQKAWNEFSRFFEHFNHCFIDFNKDANCDIQNADI